VSNTETFTASGIPEAESRVRSDLDFITEAIVHRYPSTRTVAVVGAFGRGEGAVVRRGDTFVPWNDYDLFLVSEDRSNWESLGEFGRETAQMLGIPSIDILPMLPGDILKLSDTMPVYDACHGNRILYGDGSVLSPALSTDIKSAEIFTLCVNRMICLLEAPPECLTGVPPDPLKYASQVSKTIFAVIDAKLYNSGGYVTSYRNKTSDFTSMNTVSETMKSAAKDALSFRLEPRPMQWDATRWFTARDHLLSSLIQFKRGITDINLLARAHWRNRFGTVKNVLRKLASGSIPDYSCRAIECAEMLLLASAVADSDETDTFLVSRTIHYLRKSSITVSEKDWKSLSDAVVSAWFRYCHA